MEICTGYSCSRFKTSIKSFADDKGEEEDAITQSHDDYEEQNWTSLHHASFWGHADVVDLLLSVEANVNMATATGTTALYMSAQNGHVDIVRYR